MDNERHQANPGEDIPPENRELFEKLMAQKARLRAEGRETREPVARLNEPFGMDKDFRPYSRREPREPKPRDEESQQ